MERKSNPTRGSKPGERRGGRQRGSQNKVTKAAKEAIQEAFTRLGDVDGLVKWAKLNQKEFYTIIWPKIIPLQVGMDPKNPLTITMVELVAPKQITPDVELIEYRESTH
jgi:hypothetical protein